MKKIVTFLAFWGVAACGDKKSNPFSDTPEAGANDDASQGQDALLASPDTSLCTGRGCDIVQCANGGKTVISGRVFDPRGRRPLYNAVVFVPAGDLAPLPEGAGCDRCGSIIGNPVVSAVTDENGQFTLEGTPAGTKIPVVVQIGKWRKQVILPKVEGCTETKIPDGTLTLPASRDEGDMPQIAIVTGGYDELGCMFRRIGIDDKEFTLPSEGGRVHLYRGVGGGGISGRPRDDTPKAETLWNDINVLSRYDAVLLGCEGFLYDEPGDNKTDASKQAMREYINKGGRVFATHYQYVWFKKSTESDFRGIATWLDNASAFGTREFDIDTSFPKGEALSKWLMNVGPSTMVPGKITVDNPASNVKTATPDVSQRWIYQGSPEEVHYMSFNAPVGVPEKDQCGRAVWTSLHVGGERGGTPVPADCALTQLTPQELALEFLLFDLSACVQSDKDPPRPPK